MRCFRGAKKERRNKERELDQDDNCSIATKAGEFTELAGLGAGEPRSETVRATSSAGVAGYVSATSTD